MLNNKYQKGVALISMMLVVFMVGMSLFFTSKNNKPAHLSKQIEIGEQLALTKELLIAFAINYSTYYPTEGPGRLPCPDIYNTETPNTDINGDGIDDGIRYCEPPHYRYRLPNYVDLPAPFNTRYAFIDQISNADRLWYAVSPDYSAEDGVFSNTPLNSSTNGSFTLNGENDIVAVIIDPGEALENQDRSSDFESLDYLAYLEDSNATDNSLIFISSSGESPDELNDRIIGISRSEIMSGTVTKVVEEIKSILDNYFNSASCSDSYLGFFTYYYSCYPSTSDFNNAMVSSGIASWFTNDEWNTVHNYQMDAAQIGDPGINSALDLLITRIVDKPDRIATISFTGCSMAYTLSVDDGISYSPNRC